MFSSSLMALNICWWPWFYLHYWPLPGGIANCLFDTYICNRDVKIIAFKQNAWFSQPQLHSNKPVLLSISKTVVPPTQLLKLKMKGSSSIPFAPLYVLTVWHSKYIKHTHFPSPLLSHPSPGHRLLPELNPKAYTWSFLPSFNPLSVIQCYCVKVCIRPCHST